jgi:hypothetical protein
VRTGPFLRRLRASRSYGFVLALVLASFFFTAAAPDERWSASVLILLQALTLAVAVWTSNLTRRADVLIGVVSLAGVAAAVLRVVEPGRIPGGVLGLVVALVLVGTIAVIVLGIVDQHAVNLQSVLGALTIYFLLGMVYTFVYGALASLDAGPFFAQGTDGTPSLRLYFSFVTIATVGYGDYTAATDLGRTVAVTEGLFGQLYLVTVVALIVSRLRPRRRAEEG